MDLLAAIGGVSFIIANLLIGTLLVVPPGLVAPGFCVVCLPFSGLQATRLGTRSNERGVTG